MSTSVERDVQDILIGQSRCKRAQGRVPYPVAKYTIDLANLDIWDNMFFEHGWGSPTVSKISDPPSYVLDVGCGTGWWVMDMARRWLTTIFIGFDIADIQPHLPTYEHFQDIADRIRWVNGNFLEVFPFPDDHFDYVRVSRAGLAVPEDEWQWLLEEIWRVMKTGALLEIIEEDLIFPMASFPNCPPSSSPVGLQNNPTLECHSSGSSDSSDHSHLTPKDEKPPTQSKPKGRRARLTSFVTSVTSKDSNHSHSPRPAREISPPDDFDYSTHPQNHTKLKAAWDAMLATRFISSKVLSILPFYLSTLFTGVEVFDLYTVPLPTNTPLEYDPWDDDDSIYSIPRPHSSHKPHSVVVPVNPDNLVNYPIVTELPRLQAMDLYGLAGMHLHYAVEFIKSCKENIKENYHRLFSDEDYCNPRMERAASGDLLFTTGRPDSFEVEWNDWVCDMEDRMRLRHHLPEQMAWPEPLAFRGGKPRWRRWRKVVDQWLSLENRTVFEFPPNTSDLCRSVKACVAWKGARPTAVK